MLTFRRLRAEQFCQHKNLDIEFSPGLVGIIGPNGSGKSNLVKAIFRALTGKSLNPGKKEEDISWGAENGSLDLDFTVNGIAASLKRDLKTERCSLVFGEEKLRKSKDIEARLYPFLGVSPRVLSNVVFVMQGQIEGMLFQRPAERMKSFQYLFGTQNAERIRDLLQDDLTNLSVESRKEQIEQFKKRLAEEIEPPLKEALASIEKSNGLLVSDARRDEIRRMEDDSSKASYARARLPRVDKAYGDADRAVRATERDILRWSSSLQRAEEDLKALAPGIDVARKVIINSDRVGEIKSRRDVLQAEGSCCRDVMNMSAPECGVTEEDVAKAQEELQDMMSESRHQTLLLRAGRASEKVNNCPTCGQKITEEHLLEAALKIDRLKLPLARKQETLEQLASTRRTFNYGMVEYKTQKSNAEARLESILAELGSISAPDELDRDKVSEAHDIVRRYDEFSNSVTTLKLRLNAARCSLKALEVSRSAQRVELDFMKAQADKDPGTEAMRKAEEEKSKDTAGRLALAGAVSVRDRLLKQKESLLTQLKEWEDEEVKLARLQVWRERVEDTRRLLHRDALPGEVARSYMGALNGRLAYYLDLFRSDFTSEISPDTLVTCRFSGYPEVPSERLSGGQKVLLGVAFRFAIYDLFVSELGVMLLDEPTVYLDDNNVGAVTELLKHLKGFSKSSGMQLIVPTHERKLADSFDQVISLSS